MGEMSSIDEFLGPTKFICSIIGMWPAGAETILEKAFVRLIRLVSLFAFGNIVVPEVLAIVESQGQVADVARIGCVLITIVLVVIKMLYLIFNGRKLARIYSEIRDFWGSASESPRERNVYEVFARKGKIFTVVFLISGLVNNVTFASAAVFDWVGPIYWGETAGSELERRFPLEAWYGSNVKSSPKFEIAFACQIISSLFCCMGIVGLDSLMLTPVIHVCGQLSLVRFRYRDIRRTTTADPGDDPNRFLRLAVRKCLRHHQDVIRVADSLESLLGPPIFAQFVISAVEICLSSFAITTGTDKKMDLVRFTTYLISMTMQLFTWCVVGEMLIGESEGVGSTVFHELSWYEFPIDLQRDLRMVILRSQKCCRLTAAKFATMNAETLGSSFMILVRYPHEQILSSAASYFALLRQVR